MSEDSSPEESHVPPEEPSPQHGQRQSLEQSPSGQQGSSAGQQLLPSGPGGLPNPVPKEHILALAKYYRPEPGLSQFGIVPIALIHKFNRQRPHLDYLCPRVDRDGLTIKEPAQIIKTGITQAELEVNKDEPINPKRGNMRKGRPSVILKNILDRDGPDANEDEEMTGLNAGAQSKPTRPAKRPKVSEYGEDRENEQRLPEENHQVLQHDEEKENDQYQTGEDQNDNLKKKEAKKASKKVPKPKEVSQEDLEILEYQAREMPGINLDITEDDETRQMKIRLIKSESARMELEAKVTQLLQDKRITDEVIERLALRVEQLEQRADDALEAGRHRWQNIEDRASRWQNVDDAASQAPSGSRDSGVVVERRVRPVAPVMVGMHNRNVRNNTRKDLGHFTPSDDARFRRLEIRDPLKTWLQTHPVTGEGTLMRHLCYGQNIPDERWQTFKSKPPPGFGRDLTRSMYSEEDLANRALDATRITTQLDIFDYERKSLTPVKFACIKRMYDRQVDRKIPREQRPQMKRKLNDIIGQTINTAFQNVKNRIVARDSNSAQSPESTLAEVLPDDVSSQASDGERRPRSPGPPLSRQIGERDSSSHNRASLRDQQAHRTARQRLFVPSPRGSTFGGNSRARHVQSPTDSTRGSERSQNRQTRSPVGSSSHSKRPVNRRSPSQRRSAVGSSRSLTRGIERGSSVFHNSNRGYVSRLDRTRDDYVSTVVPSPQDRSLSRHSSSSVQTPLLLDNRRLPRESSREFRGQPRSSERKRARNFEFAIPSSHRKHPKQDAVNDLFNQQPSTSTSENPRSQKKSLMPSPRHLSHCHYKSPANQNAGDSGQASTPSQRSFSTRRYEVTATVTSNVPAVDNVQTPRSVRNVNSGNMNETTSPVFGLHGARKIVSKTRNHSDTRSDCLGEGAESPSLLDLSRPRRKMRKMVFIDSSTSSSE